MPRTPCLFFGTALGCALLTGAHAQDHGPAGSKVQDLDLSVQEAGPDVAVQRYANRTVEEYWYNGNPYMLKVTPNKGAAYFLVDPAGTGEYEWRRNSQGLDIRPPQWTLKSW
jgi:hypothetical protein